MKGKQRRNYFYHSWCPVYFGKLIYLCCQSKTYYDFNFIIHLSGEKQVQLSVMLVGGVTVLVFSGVASTLITTPLAICQVVTLTPHCLNVAALPIRS